MGILRKTIFVSLLCSTLSAVSLFTVVFAVGFPRPQQTEINDNLEISDPITESLPADTPAQDIEAEQEIETTVETEKPVQPTIETEKPVQLYIEKDKTVQPIVVTAIQTPVAIAENKANSTNNTEVQHTPASAPELSFTVKVYKMISDPIIKVVNTPKVNSVLRNIGTCVVNGAMELFSYYLPTPFMPLIASAAGLLIPFEPVVMLKEKMPVTTYRRALQTAMTSFLRSFDRYKMFMDDEDDYDPYMTRRFNRRFMNNDQDNKVTKQKRGNSNVEE